MIREPKNFDNVTMNVVLKNGEVFLGKDICSKPFGEAERQVCFCQGDVLMVYSMEQVDYVELVYGDGV